MKLESINPFTGELIESFETFSDSEIDASIEKSRVAQKEWRKVALSHRVDALSKVGSLLRKKVDYYASNISREMGKPIKQSLLEIKKCAWLCDYYAEYGPSFISEETVPTDAARSFVTYEPLGIVLAIMPWNFPFWQVFRCAVPSILAGNAVLLKHASSVQRCALIIEEIFREADLPVGIFKTLLISSSQVEKVVSNPAIRAVSLTGSESAGISVSEVAGKNLKKTVLELGGSNAFIVLDDADLDNAAAIGVQARMQNAGQSCIAAKRFILHKKIAEDFIYIYMEKMRRLKMGDPMDQATDIGPLASAAQANSIENQLERSLKMGARLLSGGIRKNCFFSPTVLDLVQPDMPVFHEETFGPVAPMIIAEDEVQAVKLANQTKYGLGVSIFSKDTDRAIRLSGEFDDGAVFINALVKSDPRLPFGGTKYSGYGRELSKAGILEFVNIKTVFIEKEYKTA